MIRGFLQRHRRSGGPGVIQRGWSRALGAIVVVGLLLPALAWTLLDRAPLSGDDSVYGRASLQLFRTLHTSPTQWLPRAMNVLDYKPNGLVWVGQFFVPVGHLMGSVDTGLLLSVWLTQLLTVAVLCRAVLVLSKQQLAVAVLAGLSVVSAPMFVTLGGYYKVESSQVLAVSWFILILARARQWNPAYTLCQLLGASAFACMTKTTTPLFCVWPGLATLLVLVRRPAGQAPWNWVESRVVTMAAASLGLVILTGSWYYRNWDRVLAFAKAASSGPIAAVWGKEDTFFNTFMYWVLELPRSFYYVPAVGLAVVAFLAVATVAGRRKVAEFDAAVMVAALQMITILGVFGFSANRETRYLLPLVPYVGLAAAWGVHRLQSGMMTRVALLGLGVQLVLVYGLAFGWYSNPSGYPVRPLDTLGRDRALLDSIVVRTCNDRDGEKYLNVVAIDASFRGDWLAPEPANYVAERDLANGSSPPPCAYGHLGRDFLGSNASAAWEALLADRANYVITLDPQMYGVPANAYNEALKPGPFRAFWSSLTTTGLFGRESALPEDPGIAVFRRLDRVDHVAEGRALSDQGRHALAIEHLHRATVVEPRSIEAWANLQLAYERHGDLERAVAAGHRALALSPDHYYVNLGLARALMQQQAWAAALERAEYGAAQAPAPHERAYALAVAARAAFQLRDSARGCALLRAAAGVEPDPEILSELKQTCGQ